MKDRSRLVWVAAGVVIGAVAAGVFLARPKLALAGNDRFEDYIISTGAVAGPGRNPTDGVWLLDYRSGKLLATVIDRTTGKIVGWGEADLVSEFNIAPRQGVHFVMTTGLVAHGQSALYIAETTTGKLGVYSIGPRPGGEPGVAIIKHDLVNFRQAPAKAN